MPSAFQPFKPSAAHLRAFPREKAIRSFIQNKILNGELAPGTPLPPMTELARLWQSNYFTVHKALTPLVKEGLVDRHKGVGTYVAETRRHLATIGIYYGVDIISSPQFGYAIHLHRLLHEACRRAGLQTHTWLDPRSASDSAASLLPELDWAVRHQQMQGLIVLVTKSEAHPNFDRLPLPVAYFTNGRTSQNIHYPHGEFLQRALARCAAQGRRNVALLGSHVLFPPGTAGAPWRKADAFATFQALCAAAGVSTHASWFRIVDRSRISSTAEEDRTYHEAFQAIREAGRPRPDALIIYPDNIMLSLGATHFSRGAALPDDLLIVSHSNEPAAFPLPAGPHYIALSLANVAEGLVEIVQAGAAGRPMISRPAKLLDAST